MSIIEGSLLLNCINIYTKLNFHGVGIGPLSKILAVKYPTRYQYPLINHLDLYFSHMFFQYLWTKAVFYWVFFSGFHTLVDENDMEHYDICIGSNLTCMNDLMNRMGQFDHVEYKGKQVKCRSNCEDQVNSLFVTTSSYPNRKTLIYREEFCILTKRLLQKCKGPKRRPLEREYPNLCTTLEPLMRLEPSRFCKNNAWDIPRSMVPNCTNTRYVCILLYTKVVKFQKVLKFSFESIIQTKIFL